VVGPAKRALPVFNHENPEVREYIMEIAEHWLKFGNDGWRLAVPFEIKDLDFGRSFAIASKPSIQKPTLSGKFGKILVSGSMAPSLMG
jgi:glycosidase